MKMDIKLTAKDIAIVLEVLDDKANDFHSIDQPEDAVRYEKVAEKLR